MRNVSYLQVSHFSCGRGSLRSQGGFHEPELKTHVFCPEGRVGFLFPPAL